MDGRTNTDNYSNPLCACVPRIEEAICLFLAVPFSKHKITLDFVYVHLIQFLGVFFQKAQLNSMQVNGFSTCSSTTSCPEVVLPTPTLVHAPYEKKSRVNY